MVMAVGISTVDKVQSARTPAGNWRFARTMGTMTLSLMSRPSSNPTTIPIAPRAATSMMTTSYSRARGAPSTRRTARSYFCSATVVVMRALTIKPMMLMLSTPYSVM